MKNENTTDAMFRAATEIRELKRERDSLKRKVEAAKVALTRYADTNNWSCGYPGKEGWRDLYLLNEYGFDGAAAALKEMEGE